VSPSSGLVGSSAAPLQYISARDVAKVEEAILPLVPTSEAPWLCFVLAAPHAMVYSVATACLRRLADEARWSVSEVEPLRPYRALLGAAARFSSSRLVADKAFKVLRRCATMGSAETHDARADAICRAGALAACSRAFAAHGESKAVSDNVCGLLQGLAMGDAARKEAVCAHPGLLRDIVAAVKMHNGLESAKSALWNAAVGSDERRALVVKAGGAAALASRPASGERSGD
jgi:hypothetical protein